MNSVDSPDNLDIAAPAPEESSFGDVLRQFELEHHAHPGEQAALEGTVLSVTEDSVVVDIGRKMEGILQPGTPGFPREVKPGMTVRVNVTGRNEDGYYLLTTFRVEQPNDFTALEAAYEKKHVIAGSVTEMVKGGLRVDVGVPAFLPASRSGIREMAELEKLVGQTIQCRITKLDVSNPDKPDVVVDRRVVIEEEANKARQEAFAELREGAVIEATVRNLADFGAFLELAPGVDGLLHVSDISWNKVDKPASVLSPGQKLQVKILKLNRETRKISLGLKQLTPDPWSQALAAINVGDRVKGKVVRMTDFGAFVELAPGVDGLIHLSEMSYTKRIRKPSDVLQLGENVEAVVLGIQPGDKKIALGLKQALGNPWDDVDKRFPVHSVVEGPVVNMAQFGAFVDLGDGIEGMIHIADITRDKKIQHPKEILNTGQVVKVQVLEVDREKKRIRLGMKQLEPTSADLFIQEHKVGDELTGRVGEVRDKDARIEVGEGVHARCRLRVETKETGTASASGSLDDLTAMLKNRWQGGGGAAAGPGSAGSGLRTGQVRRFRVVSLEPENRRIDVELID
ncbi:MAG: S1 RNA-binding domain-containing protein [Bryobacterales bacterium]|nr:S1 RNA-binding domain-containing protein [Bryobacterales bacterium]